jgi:hypothetical protein
MRKVRNTCGYDEKTKAFKLFDPIEKKVIVSRDVHVNEASAWDWTNHKELYEPQSPHDSTQVTHEKGEISLHRPIKFLMMKTSQDNREL